MNKITQIVVLALILIINLSIAFYCYQFNQRVHLKEEQNVIAVEGLKSMIRQMKEEVSQATLRHEELKQRVDDFNNNQLVLNKRIEGVFNDIADIKTSTQAKLAELKTTSSEMDEKTKSWIKESLLTLSSFEENLANNNQDIDKIINSKLIEFNTELAAMKQKQNESMALIEELKSKNLPGLQSEVADLSKRFEHIKESTLDIILKTEIPQNQIKSKSN